MLVINNIYDTDLYYNELKVVDVKPLNEFNLKVKFNTEETKIFQFKHCMENPYFSEINDFKEFCKCEIIDGDIYWLEGELKISALYLYFNCVSLGFFVEVTDFTILENYRVYFKFNDEEERIYDFLPLLNKGVFKQLKNYEVFCNIEIKYGCPTWLDWTIDLDPECIYDHGTRVHFENGEYKEI